jgi:uncharacterized protein (TIGR02391 family)
MHNTELEMTFDPNTIEHLGVRMYSTLPPVLAELIANSYDAKATTVSVSLNDAGTEKEITVKDDGIGMSFDDINQKFLRIGRNRREGGEEAGRKVIGKKGLGKLSFFGIANVIEVTTKKDGKENAFLLRWEDIKSSTTPNYQPTILKNNIDCDPADVGTSIVLKKIKRESDFSAEDLADSLSKIFIVEPGFKIVVQRNVESPIEIENSRRYNGLDKEIEWGVPADIGSVSDYDKKAQVTGHLIATEKPISPKTNMRGIILFSRKKMVNTPDYFSDSTSSHFFSYLTGWLEVDFIDELDEDVISTDRQSVNWGHPEMVKLRAYLQSMIRWLEQDWRTKRASLREEKITETTGVNIPDWYSKLPDDLREKVKPIVDAIVKDAELSGTTGSQAVKNVHNIVPEYPYYHWRHLHQEIKTIAEDDYTNKRYFDAAEKASRLYIQRVKEVSGMTVENMDTAFNPGNGLLMVTDCTDETELNIQNGQQMLSKGIVAGCRNPLTHNPEYQKKLVDTGLFTEKDCLDMLSMISHLFTRLEKAKLRPVPPVTQTP